MWTGECVALWPFRSVALLLAAITAMLATGCGQPPEIVSREVPKDAGSSASSESTAPTAGQANPTDRMLAALIPSGDRAWFFKLAGPKQEVDKYVDDFRSLVKSVKFSGGDGYEPTWDTPEGWVRKPGSTQMRFATISLPQDAKDSADDGKVLEVSVVQLPWREKVFFNLLLTNINRWRKQMQLPEVRAEELADQFGTLKLTDGEAMLVDLKGKLNADAMQPPFAAGAGGAMPAGHPPMARATAETKKTTDGKSAERSPSASVLPASKSKAAGTDNSDLPLKFELPEGWTPKAAPTFAVAAFAAGSDASSAADISITPMPNQGADLLMNINRWRGMSGFEMPPIDTEQVGSFATPLEVDGKRGHRVRIVAPETAQPRLALIAAMLKDGDVTWVIRMKGTLAAVDAEQVNFDKFVSSIKFHSSGQ
jgi:hypothetical protein